jgi:hypothetical protein
MSLLPYPPDPGYLPNFKVSLVLHRCKREKDGERERKMERKRERWRERKKEREKEGVRV